MQTSWPWTRPPSGDPAVYRDGKLESLITRFVHEADYILCDVEDVYVRYIQDFAASGLTNMPQSFGRVVAAYMARELAWKYDPDAEEQIQVKLEQRIEVAKSIQKNNESEIRGFAPVTLTNTWRGIYNDALQILEKEPIVSNTDDSIEKNRLAIALDNGLVESVLEDHAWNFGKQSDQIDYDTGVDPSWGWSYAFSLPDDLHRMDGVWVDEHMQQPLRMYVHEEGYIYCNYQTLYITYVSTDYVSDPEQWPAYFKRLIAARMAVDANVPGGNKQAAITQYQTRRREAQSTDAMNGAPKVIGMGSWSKTRLNARGVKRGRPGAE